MKKTVCAVIAILTAIYSGSALANHNAAGHKEKDDAIENAESSTAAAARIVDAFAVALASQDERLARKMLADNVLIAEGGGAERSFEEYAAHHLNADMQFMAGVKATLKKRDVIDSGDLAIVVSESELHGEYQSKPIHSRMMETMVLKLTDDGWRIRHIHWSSGEM